MRLDRDVCVSSGMCVLTAPEVSIMTTTGWSPSSCPTAG